MTDSLDDRPGMALFTVFAILAGYSGYLLWAIFMGMDSYEYPMKSYGDMGFRLYGTWLRYLFNFLQGAQLVLICCLVWALAGFIFGQVRTLQKFGWLANVAVWLNVICMIITMGAAAHSLPNYKGIASSAGAGLNGGISVTQNPKTGAWPKVQTSGPLPDKTSFIGPLNGAMSAVFSYGGAMIFPEFMSEMKRPRDFLKGMWFAQLFIYVCYIFYGAFMYGYQGQYVVTPSYLGIAPYNLQTAGNVFAMVSAIIAAALYGNIGVKGIFQTTASQLRDTLN